MKYEEIVLMVRNTFENADARTVFEHVAFEIDIEGEGAGAFYLEVAERSICVEPYNYFDNDGVVKVSGETLKDLCQRKYSFYEAWRDGKLRFYGNERKLKLCLDNIVLPGGKRKSLKQRLITNISTKDKNVK